MVGVEAFFRFFFGRSVDLVGPRGPLFVPQILNSHLLAREENRFPASTTVLGQSQRRKQVHGVQKSAPKTRIVGVVRALLLPIVFLRTECSTQVNGVKMTVLYLHPWDVLAQGLSLFRKPVYSQRKYAFSQIRCCAKVSVS